MADLNRRRFLKSTAFTAAAFGVHSSVTRAEDPSSPNNKLTVGIMGLGNGRGIPLSKSFAAIDGCEVAYVCDVDSRALARGVEAVVEKQARRPEAVSDFRRMLDDKSVDAIVIATPDHWHSPATILACAAGKHVYVEKPLSHNPREGELAVEAARKHDRVVQMGTQRRSLPTIGEAMDKLKHGAIGDVLYARTWYNSRRGSIGKGKQVAVPDWLNYELWQGPAPDRPYRDNYLHYSWHWFWHWGTGEMGNNGVHALDLCRWGLGVDYPMRVSSGGGKYRHDDDQETPDTHTATFDFGGKSIHIEVLSWSPRGHEGEVFGASFHGKEGTLAIVGDGYVIYDMHNKEIARQAGTLHDGPHLTDFASAIRERRRPTADVEEGHKSTLLCHLANIAYRTGRTLHCDSHNGRIQNDDEAMKLWSREYRPGWEPSV